MVFFIRRFSFFVAGFSALLLCGLVWLVALQLNSRALKALDQSQTEMNATLLQLRKSASLVIPERVARDIDTNNWPLRDTVDAIVEQVSLQALSQGVTLRAVLVVHHSATPSAWGWVSLEISTTGTYSALKSWQANLQLAHPSLAVQSVRWQASSIPGAGLDAQWNWVLHVRD